EIKKWELPGGALTAYGEAALLVLKARQLKVSERLDLLAQARSHLAVATAARPSWSRPPALQAEAYEMELEPEATLASAREKKPRPLEKSRAARDRGENRLAVYERVMQLSSDLNRDIDTLDLVQTLPEASLANPGIGRFAADKLVAASRELDDEARS